MTHHSVYHGGAPPNQHPSVYETYTNYMLENLARLFNDQLARTILAARAETDAEAHQLFQFLQRHERSSHHGL